MKFPRFKVHVVGAGGHAKVVISTLRLAGHRVEAIYDDNSAKWGQKLMGATIVGPVASLNLHPLVPAVIAIGDNGARKRIACGLRSVEWVTVIHPSASVDPSAQIGPGAVVLAGAVIQPDAIIGRHCLINSGTVISHDCEVGDYVHASASVVSGGARLGEGTFLGVGSAVIPGISIGRWCVIGAGAVVIDGLKDYVEAVGVPARAIKKLECA